MTKHVLLVRHAEAGPTPWGGADRDRALTPFGIEQAQQLGRRVGAGELPAPALALTSSAVRARETWAEAAAAAGSAAEHVVVPELYDGGVDAIVTALRGLDDGLDAVVLVAHAPDVPALAAHLEDARSDRTPLVGWAPATVGVVAFDGPWAEFPQGARLCSVVVNEGA